MANPVQQSTPKSTLKLPEGSPAPGKQTVDAISAVVDGLSSLVKLPSPVTPSPSKTAELSPSAESAQTTEKKPGGAGAQKLVDLFGKKALEAVTWVAEKGSDLMKCRSIDDLAKWGKQVFQEAVSGITDAAKQFREVFAEIARDSAPERRPEQAQPYTSMLESMVAQDSERKAELKEKHLEEAAWEHHRKALVQTESEKTKALEQLPKLAPLFADRQDVEELKIAITTNHIPTEDMPQVRRFLAAVEDLKKST